MVQGLETGALCGGRQELNWLMLDTGDTSVCQTGRENRKEPALSHGEGWRNCRDKVKGQTKMVWWQQLKEGYSKNQHIQTITTMLRC